MFSNKAITEFDPETGHPKRYLILAVMCISLVVIVLDNSILNVAIPTIARRLGSSDVEILWIINAYTIVFAALLLTAGTLGDKYGRKKVLQIGLVIFGLASIFTAIADTSLQLIIGRALMGIGGAAIMPSTLSIITNIFPDKERAKAIGIWAAFAGLGVALGPLTGGILLSYFWWGSVFIVNIPIVIAGVIINQLIVPESKNENATKIDYFSAFLSITTLTSLLYAIILGAEFGYSDTKIVSAFVISAITLLIFVIVQLKIENPMLKIEFFKDRRFRAGTITVMLTFFAMFSMGYLITQYLQLVLGYSPMQSGASFLPFSVVLFVSAVFSARISQKIGTKFTIMIGLSLLAIGLLALSTITIEETYLQFVWKTLIMALGLGLTMAPSTSAIMNSVPREKAGIGSAMNDTTRMVGGALGIAIIGSITSSIYRTQIVKDEALNRLKTLFSATSSDQAQVDELFNTISDSIGKAAGTADVLKDVTLLNDPLARQQIEAIPESFRTQIAQTITDAASESYMQGLGTGIRAITIAIVIGIVIIGIWMPQNILDSDHNEK